MKKLLWQQKTFRSLCLFCVLVATACTSTLDKEACMILPRPNTVALSDGHFSFAKEMTIGINGTELQPAAEYLAGILSPNVRCTINAKAEGQILLQLTEEEIDEGGYSLQVSPSKIVLSAKDYSGILSGIQSLRQLLPEGIENKSLPKEDVSLSVPCIHIKDAPRYEWRGLMLDVSRHFYDKEEVKELLDLMALYKMNKFHWHLTDDQGWRIEIKQYPLLTEKGAWRTFNNHDKECISRAKAEDNTDFEIPEKRLLKKGDKTFYGGYYTQEDIREIVAYAQQRGIDIIPEIDIPGHMLAAVSNYKGLSCQDKVGWGAIFSSPLCPGKDAAINFCKNVYKEIFDLFPYKYVHIGGDEVDKSNWKKCADCQRRMKENGLKTEAELQSWFNHQMEAFLNEHGKQLIGWDEIIEGGLSSTSTVMWWRSWAKDAPLKATEHLNKVIYTPNSAFYLDYQQDKNSVRTIYDFEPVMDGMTAEQEKLIMGVQGNIWCEMIPSRERLLYMAAPRMLAIAELGWSSSKEKDWEEFHKRMLHQFNRLEALQVNYRIPDIEGFYNRNVFLGEGLVSVNCPDPHAQIRYTTDGTIPCATSTLYTEPLQLNQTTEFTFRTFREDGHAGDFVKTIFIKDDYATASEKSPTQQGLNVKWYDYAGDTCADIEQAKVNGTYTVEGLVIPPKAKGNIGLIFEGYISLPKDDIYTFFLTSDDGSILEIDHDRVIENDLPHAPRQIIGQKALKAGYHTLSARYFDHNGGMLHLRVMDSKGEELLPSNLFFHE